MGGLRVYRELLGNRPLMRLLLGEAISGIGDWLYIVAIFVVIYRESGDAALVGLFGGVRLIPYVLLSVPAGIVADRFDRRLVLLVSDLFRGALMVVMTFLIAANAPVAYVAVLAIAATCGSAFFYPAMGAYLPALAKDERQLGPANSAWATIQNFSFIVGPAIGGVVLALGSVTSAFALNALSFLFIAAILWTLPSSYGSGAQVHGATEDVKEADAEPPTKGPAIHVRPLAGLGVVQLMAGFLGGGLQVITVILAIDVLEAGEEANGYLNAAIGIGGLLGGIGAGALVLRRGLGLALLIGAIVTGFGLVGLGLSTTLTPALIIIGVLAAGTLVIDVVTTTMFQRLVPDESRGRGVGILMAITTLTGAIGAFLLPVLLTKLGPFESLGGTGLAMLALTALGIVLIGRAADRAPTPYEATLAQVIKLPLFAGVPAARLEAAARKLTEVRVTAGQRVVAQGEPADRFYIIESGTYVVSQAPTPGGPAIVLRKLGPLEVFGELGLLNQAPRSATITADTDGLLLALDGADFLTLVGAGGPLRGRLLSLYAARPGTR